MPAVLQPPRRLTSSLGTMQYTPANVLEQEEDEKKLSEREQPPLIDSLTQHVKDFFEAAKSGKLNIEQQMLCEDRQIKGEYEADVLAAIQNAGIADNFIRLSLHKCRDVEAWVGDELDPTGDRTWDIEPAKDPELPPDVEEMLTEHIRMELLNKAMMEAQASGQPIDPDMLIQQVSQMQDEIKQLVLEKVRIIAEERCSNMENLILKQLKAGRWHEAFQAFINDFSRRKCAIIEGPIYRREKVFAWVQDPNSGGYTPDVKEEIIPTFRRISPYDWYPSPNSTDVDDGDLVVLDHLTRRDMEKMKGVPGYKGDIIDKIIEKYGYGLHESTPIEAERFYLEKDNQTGLYDSRTDKIDCINYWGSVPGRLLREWGMDEDDVPDETIDYQINAKVVGEYCFRAVINPDPLGTKPYGVASFVKSNDSQFGEGPAGMMTDIQQICNQNVRTLVTNIGIAGGPVWEIDISRLAPGETADVWPHKVIASTSKGMMESPAVRMVQANLLATELLAVYDKFKREADDLVVPAYGHGNSDVKGAGRTSSGLAQLTSMAGRNIKMAIANIDRYVIIPCIERMFNFNMRFVDDPSIKGDLEVRARGANAVQAKSQVAMRSQELLNATNNPVDLQIMGIQGRAELLKEQVKTLGFDPKRILPMLKDIEKMNPATMPQGAVPNEGQAANAEETDASGAPMRDYQKQGGKQA